MLRPAQGQTVIVLEFIHFFLFVVCPSDTLRRALSNPIQAFCKYLILYRIYIRY